MNKPKISQKTKNAIQKLKKNRTNRFDNINEEKKIINESSFSKLHFKYNELIGKNRELRLPVKYKKIYRIFRYLDYRIFFNNKCNKNKNNTFEHIKYDIELYTHHSFNLNIFQQILYIVPHFYIYKYIKKKDIIKNFKLNDDIIDKYYDLEIGIPKDFQDRIKKNYGKNFNFLDINYYNEDDLNFNPIRTPLNI